MGVNLLELDALAHEMIRERGAESCYIDYHPSFGAMPFGKVLCTSVNDAVLHGLPVRLRAARRGPAQPRLRRARSTAGSRTPRSAWSWVRRTSATSTSSTPRRARSTRRSAAANPGSRLGDISAAIAAVAHAEGLSINTSFGGHGVGRTMHGDPHVPNDGRPGRGYPLRPGLVIAIEPWFLQSTDQIYTDRDGWTLRSADGSRGAHMEHTVAITEDGPLVLTARD